MFLYLLLNLCLCFQVDLFEKREADDKIHDIEISRDIDTGTDGDRGNWANQIEFFLSCLAYAVGIGNVWR